MPDHAAPKDGRAERLAARLRDNLHRRKAQTRAQSAREAPPRDDDGAR